MSADAPRPRPVALVIDDEQGVRESFRVIFEGEFEVLEADRGAKGLEVLRSRRVDVVLLDVRMPGPPGPTFLPQILALDDRIAVIIVSASGGARMYEGMLSLMQMAKTSGALARHAEQRLPYISVLTNPTTAGVMASFASLGDVILAEPKSMIGFAGPRVIKETTHQDLPKGFQTAEFLEEHGLIDMIVHRKKMREQISQLLGYFSVAP